MYDVLRFCVDREKSSVTSPRERWGKLALFFRRVSACASVEWGLVFVGEFFRLRVGDPECSRFARRYGCNVTRRPRDFLRREEPRGLRGTHYSVDFRVGWHRLSTVTRGAKVAATVGRRCHGARIIARVAFLRKRRGLRLSATIAKITVASENQSGARYVAGATLCGHDVEEILRRSQWLKRQQSVVPMVITIHVKLNSSAYFRDVNRFHLWIACFPVLWRDNERYAYNCIHCPFYLRSGKYSI